MSVNVRCYQANYTLEAAPLKVFFFKIYCKESIYTMLKLN